MIEGVAGESRRPLYSASLLEAAGKEKVRKEVRKLSSHLTQLASRKLRPLSPVPWRVNHYINRRDLRRLPSRPPSTTYLCLGGDVTNGTLLRTPSGLRSVIVLGGGDRGAFGTHLSSHFVTFVQCTRGFAGQTSEW
ncbi:hypothetical protein DPEC_G00326850 [Dallia pectoralis]|uniref:Uncharacterized protein n=1 Tax=Dallia pectoralis TaxID=75939 RepID=A0ACC2F7X3_DALPE|nr:hypothetical protein DPEC_G00326850 [Dallia pectoralis]